ncbi:MAG TPA: helix-turn-helix domain-containing protein [Steroidobacteraceae bacterium]|nr:helix-turn-helix domain-containing protein [Steroidobacteraceae bacterium]
MIRRLDKQDRVFRALGHATRREILDFLRAGPRTTGEVCAAFQRLDRCTVMQHLGVLERAELLVARVDGRQRWNYLNALPIKEIHDRWIGRYAANAAGILARLARDLERGDATPVESRSRRATSR